LKVLSGVKLSLKELSGAMGDWGTLLPIAMSFMAVNGMHPAHFMVVFGAMNIATGLIYRLPMPLQPMKAIAAVAIAQQWSPDLITSTALSMGIFWLLISISPGVDKLFRKVPNSVVRGIQLALGITLGLAGLNMIFDGQWWLGLVTAALILYMNRGESNGPAAVVVIFIGIVVMLYQGDLNISSLSLSTPDFTLPDPHMAWRGFVLVGAGQIPLTLTNAVIACVALLREYFPDRPVGERKLMLNMGVMNIVASMFGGFPMCHGAGGLASHYYFGARTGGANVMEGIVEVLLGIFFGTALLQVFSAFPMAIVGAMMTLVGVEMGKFTQKLESSDWIPAGITALLGVIFNLGIGFLGGLLAYILRSKFAEQIHGSEN